MLAIVRDRPLEPLTRITTERESQVLYGADGTALAEFSNDHVIAWSATDGADNCPDAGPDGVPPNRNGANGTRALGKRGDGRRH